MIRRALTTKDRERYAELRLASRDSVRAAVLRDIAANRRESGTEMDRLSASVAALELSSTIHVWNWLRPGALRRAVGGEFDALAYCGWVRSIAFDQGRWALAVTAATLPPRNVHLPLVATDCQAPGPNDAGSDASEGVVSTLAVAAQILASAGDLRSAVRVLLGPETTVVMSVERAEVDQVAREVYMAGRMLRLQHAACGAGPDAAAQVAQSRASRRLQALAERLAALEKTVEVLDAQFAQSFHDYTAEYDMLCELPGVSAIKVRSGVVHVETEPVTIPYQGFFYDLGRYRIEIRLGDRVRFLNLDCRVEGTSGPIDHPHCTDTRPCWGNAAGFFATRLAQRDLPAIIQQAVSFLEQYNPSSAFVKVDRWPSRVA